MRPFRADDFADAAAFASQETAGASIPPLPAGDGAAVERWFEQWRRSGEMLHLVIADADTDTYLGEVSVVIGEHHVGELGCGLVDAARGRGIATTALRLTARWCFAELGLARLQMFIVEKNDAALRLAARAGFQQEGRLRAYWEDGGSRLDTVVLSRLPSDQERH